MNRVEPSRAKFSIPSIIAIIAAFASFATGAFAGFILALVAMFFGSIGMLIALSPRVRGGVVSFFSLIVAGVALIAAIFKALRWIF